MPELIAAAPFLHALLHFVEWTWPRPVAPCPDCICSGAGGVTEAILELAKKAVEAPAPAADRGSAGWCWLLFWLGVFVGLVVALALFLAVSWVRRLAEGSRSDPEPPTPTTSSSPTSTTRLALEATEPATPSTLRRLGLVS